MYIYLYIYTKIKKPKTRCVGGNIKQKNTKNSFQSTEIFVTIENVFFCLIYIYMYIFIYIYIYIYIYNKDMRDIYYKDIY